MSAVPSLSPSQSNSSTGSVSSWEAVSLSPLELLAAETERELQHANDAFTPSKQNKNGIDLDARTGKAAGQLTVQVLAVDGIADAVAMHPIVSSTGAQPVVYVSTSITPTSACEKSTKKHLRTASTAVVGGHAQWNDTVLSYVGVKASEFTVKVVVNCSAGVIADVALGECELRSQSFLDQGTHTQWVDLQQPSSVSSASGATHSHGKVQLSITFQFDARRCHEQQLEALAEKKKEYDAMARSFRETAPLVKPHAVHPAAFGKATACGELYIPGNRFHVEAHHPGAVTRTPLPDKSRVTTPYGRGIVVSFRRETRVYIVQLDTNIGSKKATVAYVQAANVQEEPTEPHFKMYMKVSTPYGDGEIQEIRPNDDVIVVKAAYATMFMHRKNVRVPEKLITDMNTKELVDEAVGLTDVGNELFRNSKYDEAVFQYLRALQFLQRVNQDMATHKEKATILQTMIRCHLNIGTCKLKVDAYGDAEIACTNALSILTVLAENKQGNVVAWMGRLGLSEQLMFEDWPSKARFRRAKACVKLGKYSDAKDDLLVAVKLNPKDKACRMLLEQVVKTINKHKSADKKAWGGIFENTPEQTTSTAGAAAPSNPDASIFTRKTKAQKAQEVKRQQEKQAAEPWYLSSTTLAAASLVTAGVAAMAVMTLKQQRT